MGINGYLNKPKRPPHRPLTGPGSNSLNITPKHNSTDDGNTFGQSPTTTDRLLGRKGSLDYLTEPAATEPDNEGVLNDRSGSDANQNEPFGFLTGQTPTAPKPGPTLENAKLLAQGQALPNPVPPPMMSPADSLFPAWPGGLTVDNIGGSGDLDTHYVPPPVLDSEEKAFPPYPDGPTELDIDAVGLSAAERETARLEAERAVNAAGDMGGFTSMKRFVPRWDEMLESGVKPADARKLADAPPVVVDALINGDVSTEFALLADDPSSATGDEIIESLEIDTDIKTPEKVERTQHLISLFVGHEGPLVDKDKVRNALVSESGEPFDLEPLLPTFTDDQQKRLDVLTEKVGSERWKNYIREADVGLRASGVGYADYTASMIELGYVNGNALQAENKYTDQPAFGADLGITGELEPDGTEIDLNYLNDKTLQAKKGDNGLAELGLISGATGEISPLGGTAKVLSGLGLVISGGSILAEVDRGEFLDSPQDGAEATSFVFGAASLVVSGPVGWVLGGVSVVAGVVSLFLPDNTQADVDTPVQDVLDFQFKKMENSDEGVTQDQRDRYEEERDRYVVTSLQLTEERFWSRSAEEMQLENADEIEREALWVHANNENLYVEPGKHVNAVPAGTKTAYIFQETDPATGTKFTRVIIEHPKYGISEASNYKSDDVDIELDRNAIQSMIDNGGVLVESEPPPTPAPAPAQGGPITMPGQMNYGVVHD